jgi:hypothetical protein
MGNTSSSRRLRLSNFVSLLVLVVMSAAALAAIFVTRGVERDQEPRLLAERADEISARLARSFTSLASSLRVLGEVGASYDPAAARV